MKNKLLLILFVSMYMHVCAQSDIAVAKWMQQPVKIDGINKEWGSLNFYDDQTQLSFAIADDSNNIYLCFESTDELSQMKIMRAGMKITLSTKSKPKLEASVTFPLPQAKQADLPHDPDNHDSLMSYPHTTGNKQSFRQNFIKNHSVMNVAGFTTINGEVPVNDSSIQAAINWDSASNIIYEICIAKKEFFGAEYTIQKDPGNITLNVEVNALQYSGQSGNKDVGYEGEGPHGSGMYGDDTHDSGSHGVDFNGSREKYASSQETLANEAHKVSLNTKTSFKQKFTLGNNSN